MLIGVLATFVLGQVLCALAGNYALLLAARLLVSFARGVFFGVSLIIIGALVLRRSARASLCDLLFRPDPRHHSGRPGRHCHRQRCSAGALSFWFVGALSTLATIAVIALVPRRGRTASGHTAIRAATATARQAPEVYLTYLADRRASRWRFFTFITYQVPMMRDITGVDPAPDSDFPACRSAPARSSGIFFSGRLTGRDLMPAMIGLHGGCRACICPDAEPRRPQCHRDGDHAGAVCA